MTQAQIRKKRLAFEKQIKSFETQIEHVRVEWRALEDECEHPGKRTYSAMGELGEVCDDCGYQT